MKASIRIESLELDMEIHDHENNAESEKHLQLNTLGFKSQCGKLLEWLMQEKSINADEARDQMRIRHLARRIKDLKEMKFQISDYWKDNLKVYYMSPSDLNHNKQLLIQLANKS